MVETFGGDSAPFILDRSGVVAGMGLRAKTSEQDLRNLLDATLSAVHVSRSDLIAIATMHTRADHPALLALAATLGVPVLALAAQDLDRPVPNPSMRVSELAATPSVAEAAALHFGPLLIEKRRSASATCALSRYSPAERGGNASASIAASTLPTSSAGP